MRCSPGSRRERRRRGPRQIPSRHRHPIRRASSTSFSRTSSTPWDASCRARRPYRRPVVWPTFTIRRSDFVTTTGIRRDETPAGQSPTSLEPVRMASGRPSTTTLLARSSAPCPEEGDAPSRRPRRPTTRTGRPSRVSTSRRRQGRCRPPRILVRWRYVRTDRHRSAARAASEMGSRQRRTESLTGRTEPSKGPALSSPPRRRRRTGRRCRAACRRRSASR